MRRREGHSQPTLAGAAPIDDNPAMPHSWHGACAWCGQIITGALVTDHGVPYHAICHARRAAFLDEYARPGGEPEGLIPLAATDARRRATAPSPHSCSHPKP